MEGVTTKAHVEELTESLAAVKKDVAELAKRTQDKAVTAATSWSKEHPIATVGIVAGIGFVLGFLVRRNKG